MMKSSIPIITVKNQEQGLKAAKEVLYKRVDNQTVLFLSGGSTPKGLYETLAKEGKLNAKAVGLVDERIDRSNYKMIKSTGLLDCLEKLKIKFYPMIFGSSYEKDIRKLIDSSKNKVAVMGIGEDGHTASLPASPKLPLRRVEDEASQRGEPAGIKNSKLKIQNYVTEVDNFPIEPKERITLTFKALSEMNLLIILVFGKEKKKVLKKMFEKGPIEELPSRFYVNPDIAPKTLLITDQKI